MNKKIKRLFNNFKEITSYYEYLVEKTKKFEYVSAIDEWVIDNYFLVVEHKNSIMPIRKQIARKLKKSDKLYYIMKDMAVKNNYNLSFEQLVQDLNIYQKEHEEFFMHEDIEMILSLLTIIYMDRLSEICKGEYRKFQDRDKVTKIIEKNRESIFEISNFFDAGLNIDRDTNYIFEINSQLSSFGVKANEVFKKLNSILETKNINIKEVINEEYQNRIETSILVSNIFNDLKEFSEFSQDDINKNISKCEKNLFQDEIYSKMTKETKILYRGRIFALAKKYKLDEVTYTDELLKKAKREGKHIGEYLFDKDKNRLKSYLYIASIFILTILLTIILSNFFISNKVIGFIILFIPVRQLIIQLLNQFLLKFCETKPLPKMDFSKGIPANEATMVVIPTIINDTKKIKKMFDKLETYFLVNKTNNLYFTLLGDIKASDKEVMLIDKEISKYGAKYASDLNTKYKKEIFHFIYRKRIYNEKENCYLGYERKRGALLQFNRLLLNKLSDEEQKKYFNVHTFKDFDIKIKYVITLDTDTQLVLNTALNLVGAMAHPLNKPVFNASETRVIDGYGILQPKINVDIEATSKSLYSQIFAGIGGFDTYNSVVPNIGQDLFGEGSFVGKGIYNLEVFDKILYNKFPDNLILSHDLIEGNYMRCGFISDIELIDDFPSKFLIDVTRQHRWARGDTQIIEWLFPKVRNKQNEKVKNPISFLGKWKIFDNIARMFLYLAFLLIQIFALIDGLVNPVWWMLFVIIEISLPIIFFLRTKLYAEKRTFKIIYYKNLMFGGKSVISRSFIVLTTIPYYAKMYMDAFFKSMYRLLISKKNLLNWITAEEAEKTVKSDLFSYVKTLSLNIILGLLFLTYAFIFNFNYLIVIVALIYISAPFILYYVSKDIIHNKIDLDEQQLIDIKEVARRTWKFFEDNLTQENNYLIPDNYQENREQKLDNRTSPTNIGFSIVSIISAYKLGFIDKVNAISLLEKIITTVKSLEKWNGHLYNWYNIKTKQKIYPHFVSTVDSGNFVAALIVLKEFLNEKLEFDLAKDVSKLITNTNFKYLYIDKDVFSIGYDTSDAKLSIFNYNNFASESRLTSYIAISKGDVPNKHWFCLDKSLTTYNKSKGLISWSGTSFEYYMPLIFMKNYSNTLLDESYKFAFICQKGFAESVSKKIPWGTSESAYAELDNSLNYKYKTFSTPYLKAKEDKENRIVLSPYSSIMAMELFPTEVYENMSEFMKLEMLSDYGFYESYDYDNRNIVKAYFSHHQGMILASLTNYLEKNLIKNYFHNDVSIKTFEILMKEKVQIKTSINLKLAKYKKYDYNKEVIENDIRSFDNISDMPEISVLSNKKYCLLMNDRGSSFSRYRNLQLNRYRKITEQDYGMFIYIKNVDTGKVWSNTYAPINIKPDKYDVTFAADRIKYTREDDEVTTKTEIIVTKDHHAEIRKVTFTNNSDEDITLELTTYTEPILSENVDDVSHRVFNNMFLSSEYDAETNSLITLRKDKEGNNVNSYMINRLVIENPLEEYQFETERDKFIGRNRNTNNPEAINRNLYNVAGTNLEPIMSLRNKVLVEANTSSTVYFINGFGRSKEQLMEIVNSYSSKKAIRKAFDVATLMSVTNTRKLNIKGHDMRLFNIMLNYLYQTTNISINEERKQLLTENALTQSGLWKFGVSGDRPIILINIHDILDLTFVKEILKAFEYYKSISIFVDIIIINSENEEYANIIKKEIDDELFRIYTLNDFKRTPGSVTVIPSENISAEEMSLLRIVPRLLFDTNNHSSLKESIDSLQKINRFNDYKIAKTETSKPEKIDEKEFDFFNSYGGFINNGSEYKIVNRDTPKPWINVIANKEFGTIVTNNGCGFTYCYNSNEYKITSWTNDTVLNDKSEGIRINDELFDPTTCIHGFGYSVLKSSSEVLDKQLTEFVANDDNIKIYILKLTNKTKKDQELNIDFWINPIFGDFEEKTSRHILAENIENENYIRMRNVYSINYSDVTVFMSSSEKIVKASVNEILVKSIRTKLTLNANEAKEIVFTLGCSKNSDDIKKLLDRYNNLKSSKKELEIVKDKWKKNLSIINIETPDKSLDYMLNGWYLYQAMSSRIMAKAGFYQVSGAFGYRDQLQDATNVVYINPELTKEQIIRNAKHQFETGDVLHWWHEKNKFGLRSRYKDDHLWLVYATTEYLKATNDYSILDVKIPFVTGESLKETDKEKGIIFSYSNEEKTLYDHCLLSLNLSINSLGKHGIPLMGGGDWNDGMNKVGIKGKGESVWLGFFLYDIINEFTKVIKLSNKKIAMRKYELFNKLLKESLNKNTWDGKYYIRAFFDNGNKLGSSANEECKIDLISQSFSILSEVAEKSKIDSIISSVENNLVDNDNKIIKLLTPAFSKSKDDPGYIMNYPKGIRENGGQYTHATAWYIMSLIKTGYKDRAYDYYQMINPINRTIDKRDVNKYCTEPYVIAADIYSATNYQGRGGWTWYTGSAGWFYRVGMRDLLGFTKEGTKLYIKPNIPNDWKEYKITYRYIDTVYFIEIEICKEDSIIIDNKKIEEKYIELINDKVDHYVKVKINNEDK